MIEQFYGDIHPIHLVMGVMGNITSILWGAWGAWMGLKDRKSFSWIKYFNENVNRVFFGFVFTIILFIVIPVIIEELFPGLEFSPLTAFAFSLFPIPAMTKIVKKLEEKIK